MAARRTRAVDSTVDFDSIGATETQAEFASLARYEDLTPAAVAATKRLILDTLACSVAGVTHGAGAVVARVLADAGGNSESTLLATGRRTSALSATYINAHAGNVLDADDTLRYKGHVGSATVPTALAFAERQHSSGRDLIAGVAVGYEVAGRVGLSLKGPSVGDASFSLASGESKQIPVTGYSWTAFAATVTAGRSLGLDAHRMRAAFGVTGSTLPVPSSTPFGRSVPRPMTKYVMYGAVAHSGALAALLAEQGYTADPAVFDGEKGLWRTLAAHECDWAWLLNTPGAHWLVEDASFKPYPACRLNNVAIDLFLDLQREHGFSPDQIDRVEVSVPVEAELRKHRSDEPTVGSSVDASFSIPYVIGAAACGGEPGPHWLDESSRTDPRIAALAAKVIVGVDPRADTLAAEDFARHGHVVRLPTTMRITCGTNVYARSAEHARGDAHHAEMAFTDADVADKFRRFCRGILPDERIERVIELVWTLDEQNGVAKLAASLTATAD